MSRKKVIQLGGSVRSGTTITGLILGNRSNAIMLGEVMHLFKPYHHLHYEKIKELKSDERWSKVLSDGALLLYENIFQLFPDTNLIIDSSKDPFWFKHLSEVNNDLDIRQIITFKSPNGIKHSFKKRGSKNFETVYSNYYRRFFTLFPECRTIYTELHLDNEALLGDLQAYFKLRVNSEAVKYWKTPHPNFLEAKQ